MDMSYTAFQKESLQNVNPINEILNQENGLYNQFKQLFDIIYDLLKMKASIYLAISFGFGCLRKFKQCNELIQNIKNDFFEPFKDSLPVRQSNNPLKRPTYMCSFNEDYFDGNDAVGFRIGFFIQLR